MENLISFEWSSLLPEITLFCGAIVILITEAFLPKRAVLINVFSAAVAILSVVLGVLFARDTVAFNGTLGASGGFGIFITACALLSILLGYGFSAKGGKKGCEFSAVLLISAAALSIFVRAQNLMLAFVALECATISLYALSAWNPNKATSLEASAKYLVNAAVSGGLFLLGIAFIYGSGLESKVDFLVYENFTLGLGKVSFVLGILLVVSAGLFKISAFPFQFWSPDVYQGSPTPTSAFFAVGSKAAGVVFLAKVFMALDFSAVPQLADRGVLAASVIAALTIAVGNLGGLTQTNVKRLMAFSGISNAGYLLVLLTAGLKLGSTSTNLFEITLYFYLAAYMFANYGIFFVINQFDGTDDSNLNISDFRGLIKKSKISEASMVVNLASLAGIPPTAGFFGKLLILMMAWYAQLYILMTVMILGSAVSIFYYFSWMRATMDAPEGNECKFEKMRSVAPTILALSLATLLFGVSLIKM